MLSDKRRTFWPKDLRLRTTAYKWGVLWERAIYVYSGQGGWWRSTSSHSLMGLCSTTSAGCLVSVYPSSVSVLPVQGFGVAAKSTQDCRHADPASIVVFHQADVGEYLRSEGTLTWLHNKHWKITSQQCFSIGLFLFTRWIETNDFLCCVDTNHRNIRSVNACTYL